jgi:hypothetical protein
MSSKESAQRASVRGGDSSCRQVGSVGQELSEQLRGMDMTSYIIR